MLSLQIIVVITITGVAFAVWEYFRHQNFIKKIPVRIHINGTRGKSSVTRLIGAGLRAGGYRTVTKVTGTFPRLIMSDGTESAIFRKEKANILEQLNVIKFAARQNTDVLILECMALRPNYQRICEHQMVKATHGVITNIRLDHLDVMGPTLDEVAYALCGTIPKNTMLFTSEDRCFNFMKKIAKKRKTNVFQSLGDEVSDEEMQGFRYIEHKANVDLALEICASLGVNRDVALAEMKTTIPDEGVLTKSIIHEKGKVIYFYNGFAANDPESTLMIWNTIQSAHQDVKEKIILLNTRKDRQDRARQLVETIASEMDFDKIALIGESCELVEEMALKNKIAYNKIIMIGWPSTQVQYQKLFEATVENSVVLGVGNMGVGGSDLAKFFEKKHQQKQ
tara:strand:+ start:746 stop:1927 length:1182 start_codon:yes stop_codon:yes gene_type:complete